MTDLTASRIIKFAVLIMVGFTLLMCIYWYPTMIPIVTMLTMGSKHELLEFSRKIQMIFYETASVSLVIPLALTWRLTGVMKKGKLFTKKAARLTAWISATFFIDSVVFYIGNMAIRHLSWGTYTRFYLAFASAGMVFSIVISMFSSYISKAASLKAQTEGLI